MVLTENQKEMAENNHNLIYFVLNRMNLPIGDYYGAASVGLCKAACGFRPDEGKFSTFAIRCIRNEVLLELRSERKFFFTGNGTILYFDEPVKAEESSSYLDLMPNGDDFEQKLLFRITKYEFMNRLKNKERFVFEKLLEGFNTYEIASALNQTHQSVSLIKNKILRTYFEGGYSL